MVNSTLDKKAIELRAANLAGLEEAARSSVLLAGHSTWLLGNAIKATLEDVRSLLEVANGDASRPIVDALVGTLRAHGAVVSWPGEVAAGPRKSIEIVVKVDDESGGYQWANVAASCAGKLIADGRIGGEPEDNCIIRDYSWVPGAFEAIATACGATVTVKHVRVDGDDQIVDPPKSDTTPAPPPAAAAICPNCDGPMPEDGSPCQRYLDCSKVPASVANLDDGAFIRIVGGAHDSRHARVGAAKPGSLAFCVALLGRSVVPVGAVNVPHERLVVVGDDPDVAHVEHAAEPARNEPLRTAAEWQPTATQIREYAGKLSKTEERVGELVAAFKVATAASSPGLKMKRWGKTFVDWAEATP